MPVNDPYALQASRTPRAKILVNGQEIPGIISFTTTNNNFYQSDTFRASFALNASPNFDVQFWGNKDTKQFLLDLQASMDGGETFQSLLIGQVDHLAIALDKGTVSVDGRDLTAYFIDNKTQETFLNHTSSQVAEILAARRGLQADVVPTSTLVGRYYSEDHDRINMGSFTRTTTEWNLLCSLAQHEQFDVWVTGTTLHFRPANKIGTDPYLVVWDPKSPWAAQMTIDLERSMNMAKDVVVQVRSWNSRQSHSITKFSPSGARIGSITSGKEQLFTFVVANLTEAGAQDLANQIRADITKHERLLNFSMPADLILMPRMMLKFEGTGSSWDGAEYYIDSVSRTMSQEDGFRMDVRTKNHKAQTIVLSA